MIFVDGVFWFRPKKKKMICNDDIQNFRSNSFAFGSEIDPSLLRKALLPYCCTNEMVETRRGLKFFKCPKVLLKEAVLPGP